MGILKKLEVNRAPGLTYSQQFLSVCIRHRPFLSIDGCILSNVYAESLKSLIRTMTWSRCRPRTVNGREGILYSCKRCNQRLNANSVMLHQLDCRLLQCKHVSNETPLDIKLPHVLFLLIQMDDCLVYDTTGSVVVAGVDLCLAWVWYRRTLRRPECTAGRRISHPFSRR